jgi:hypothetical protein
MLLSLDLVDYYKVLFSKYYVKKKHNRIDGKRYEFPVVEGSETKKPLILKNYES